MSIRPEDRKLDTILPESKPYLGKYPLSAYPPTGPMPGVIGVNWYTNFDRPVHDGIRWWVGRGDLGTIRGGHCVCIYTPKLADLREWHAFYDQGSEGACVGFGVSRMMTLMNRKRYDAFWTYHTAQTLDPWAGEAYSGTSVDAGLQVLHTRGNRRIMDGVVDPAEGISAYRWTSSVDEILRTIGSPLATSLGAVPILNSWGVSFPHKTWFPGETMQRLLDERGDCAFVVDR